MLASFVGIYLSKHHEREGEAPRALPVEGATCLLATHRQAQAPVIEISYWLSAFDEGFKG
jgi:hypothetical protein